MKIFDTHAHYDDDRFDEDREYLLDERGLLKEVSYEEIDKVSCIDKITNIGFDIESSENSVGYANKYDFMYAAIGVIPHHVADMKEEDIESLRRLVDSSDKVVAIGEIGLDYYYDEPDRDLQKKWFVRQMDFAREVGLPIVIHSREAAKDTYDLMCDCHAEEIGGVVHCYSYTEEMAREFMKLGFFFGIGGTLTFKNSKKLRKAVAAIPIENIVLETDSPYLTPSPNRGKRNDSRYLPYVVAEIARLKDMSMEDVARITYQNACKLYRIK
ncbi:MAG: TatD family hydrolase [Eubacterium sp.]|nr:TatD family hydrolase [Eubacterium sp.]